MNVDQIVSRLLKNNQNRADLLQQYQGCRHYSLRYKGFPSSKSAEMVVAVNYTAPADKQFRILHEDGSQMLLNRVLKKLLESEKEALNEENRKKTALTPENYEFQLAGKDTIGGRPQYILQVIPRFKSKFLYQGKIWVDAQDYAVSRISAEPAKNPSFWISHTEIEHKYDKVGDFWLPSQNMSVTKVRVGGTAQLKIDYFDYAIGSPAQNAKSSSCEIRPEAKL